MGLEKLIEHSALDAIVLEQLPDVEDDRPLRTRQAVDGPAVADRIDGFRGDAGLPSLRHMSVPDVAAVLLTSRRADGQLGVLRLDDALPVEILADLVPGPRQAGAVQDDGGRAADPAPERRQLVEESVVLGGDVFLVDDELHARHRIVLSGTRDGPRPQRSTSGQSLAGPAGSVNAARAYNGANPDGGGGGAQRRSHFLTSVAG